MAALLGRYAISALPSPCDLLGVYLFFINLIYKVHLIVTTQCADTLGGAYSRGGRELQLCSGTSLRSEGEYLACALRQLALPW